MSRRVYLIGDRKWQDVLSLVPISIWTEPPSRQPLLTIAVTHVAWRAEDDADAQGTIQFLGEDGPVHFGELRGAAYRALSRSHSLCPLAIRLSGPFDQPESRLDLEMEGGIQRVLSLPRLSLSEGEERTLYVATDGSTYADDGLQTLVQAQPDRPVQKVPTLVYHQEANGIDVDSTLHFLRSYLSQTSETTVIHVGPFPAGLSVLLADELQEQQIQMVESVQTLQEDKGTDTDKWVIVAHDDYQSGLVAAAFASLHRALLLFIDTPNLPDYQTMMTKEKEIYLVGNVDEGVASYFRQEARKVTRYTCEQVQQLYLNQTQTDKIILVNPDDLHLQFEERNPALLDKTGGDEIRRFYGRTSLVAPFLAAVKHELILPVLSTDHKAISRFLEETIQRWNIRAQYLTIVASPEAIPMAIPIGKHPNLSVEMWVELDSRYASLSENEAEVDLAVGRIFGITVSDCSSYVARTLFFDDLKPLSNRKALLVLAEDKVYRNGEPDMTTSRDDLETHLTTKYYTPQIQEQFVGEEIYLDDEVLDQVEEIWEHYQEAALILYTGHGTYNGFYPTLSRVITSADFQENQMYLSFPVIIGVACCTGGYEWLKNEIEESDDPDLRLTELFVAQNIRRGAMGQQCAVGYAYWHEECDELLRGLYIGALTLGKAFRQAKNAELKRNGEDPHFSNLTDGKVKGDPHYVLVGDPTFRPKRAPQPRNV